MKVTHVFMAIAAADHAAAVGWYERFLGRGPDMVPTEGEAVWRLADSASVYIVADPDRAGRAAVTIAVRDLDELLGDLRERGIAATIVMDAGMRTAAAVDPDGNRIKFFEDPGT
jgi:catechol 2,3-dioxygenase-like lactoylglutathione lyase family enzyme